MEVDLIFKIAAIGILVAVLMMVVQEIASLFDLVKDLFGL